MAVQTPAVVFHPQPPQAAVPAAPAAPRSPSVGLDDLNSCMTCSRLRLGAEMLSWYSCGTAGGKGGCVWVGRVEGGSGNTPSRHGDSNGWAL